MRFILKFTLLLLCFISFTKMHSQPVARYGHTLTEVDGEIFLFGGTNIADNSSLNDLWLWNSDTQEWDEKTPTGTLPPSRSEHSTAVSGASGENKIYVFCGVGEGWLNDVWSYSPSNNEWVQEPSTGDVPSKRRYHTSTTLTNGRIFLFGGQAQSDEDKSYVYDPSTGVWEMKNGLFPGEVRQEHCAFLGSDGNPYIFGGYDNYSDIVSSLYRYNLTTDSWEYISHNAAQKRGNVISTGDWPGSRAGAAWAQDMANFFVIGGTDYYSNPQKELWKYTFASESWTKLDDLPHQHSSSVAAITKDSQGNTKGILLYGGEDGKSTYEVDLSPKYNLTTNIMPPEAITANCTVTLNPSTQPYEENTKVTITATPGNGWVFKEWGGDGSGNNTQIEVTMTSDKNVTAIFEQSAKYNLTTKISPTNATGCSVNPQSSSYNAGESVTLTAIDNPTGGWYFSNWSGDASGDNKETTVTMDKDKTAIANFVNVTLTISGTQKHSIMCPDTVRNYPYLMLPITFTASPDDDWSVTSLDLIPSGTGNELNDIKNVYIKNGMVEYFNDSFSADNTKLKATLNPALQIPRGASVTIWVNFEFKYDLETYGKDEVRTFHLKTNKEDIIAQPLTYSSGLKIGAATSDTLKICRVYNEAKQGFSKIQDAIDSPTTKSGDTCYVCAGSYVEPVVIKKDKSINLTSVKGEKYTFLEPQIYRPAVWFKSSKSSVSGFTFTSTEEGLTAINIEEVVNSVRIHDNVFTGTLGTGIYARPSAENHEIFNNEFYKIKIFISLYGNYSKVIKNTFYCKEEGSEVIFPNEDSGTPGRHQFSDNIFYGKFQFYLYSHHNKIFSNTYTNDSEFEIIVEGSANEISNNTLNKISILNVKYVEFFLEENIIKSNKVSHIVNKNSDSTKIISNTNVKLIEMEDSKGISIMYNDSPIVVKNCTDSKIVNNFIYQSPEEGIKIINSSNITVFENSIKDCFKSGIFLKDTKKSKVQGNLIQFNEKYGIYLLNSKSNWIENNQIQHHWKHAGIYLYSATNTIAYSNFLNDNCTGINVNKSLNTILTSNKIINSKCTNTGISVDNSDIELISNEISANNGNGIKLKNDSFAKIESNNIFDNSGFGLDNSENSNQVTANNNYWGSTTPTENDFTGNVITDTWLSEATSLVLTSEIDTVLTTSKTDSFYVIANNLQSYEGSVDVTISDNLGWISSPTNSNYIFSDSTGVTIPIYFSVPENTDENNIVNIVATLNSDTSVSASVQVVLQSYKSILNGFIISQDSLTITTPDSVQFSVAGYDQYNNGMDVNPIWSTTAGTIDSSGFFRTTTEFGEVTIVAVDTVTNIADSTILLVLESQATLDYITIEPDTIKLKQNEVQLFTAKGFNNYGFSHHIEPVWEATGGFIDEEGLLIADSIAGEFNVVVTDTLTGKTAQALIIIDEPTDVRKYSIPKEYSLNQNYPNPFNPSTTISYGLPFDSKVKVEIFDVLGQLVDIIANGVESAGLHSTHWDAGHLASGIYIIRINATSISSNANFTKSMKMLLVK